MTISEMTNMIGNGMMDKLFLQIYRKNDREKLRQRVRYLSAAENFSKKFPLNNEINVFSAPAQVEIDENYTEKHYGKVLSAAVTSDLLAICAINMENIIRLYFEENGLTEIDLSDITAGTGTFSALAGGIISEFEKKQHKICGFDAYITSDIPNRYGFSILTSFEVLLAKIISHYNQVDLDIFEIAKICQCAERKYYSKNYGLINQLTCLTGGITAFNLKETEYPLIEKINIDFSDCGYSLCFINAGSNSENYSDEHEKSAGDIKSVSDALGVEYLSEADDEYFYSNIAEIRRKCGDSAVLSTMCFLEGNHRIEEEKICLESGCFNEFLKLVNESGDSSAMRISSINSEKFPEVYPAMVALAVCKRFLRGGGAVRIHSCGKILAIVPDYMVNGFTDILEGVFGEGSTHIMSIRNSGAKLLY